MTSTDAMTHPSPPAPPRAKPSRRFAPGRLLAHVSCPRCRRPGQHLEVQAGPKASRVQCSACAHVHVASVPARLARQIEIAGCM